MPHCINCSKKLTILNKPTFKLGVLLDGNEICFNCYSKLSKLNSGREPNCKTLTQKEVIEKIKPPKSTKGKKDNTITIGINKETSIHSTIHQTINSNSYICKALLAGNLNREP